MPSINTDIQISAMNKIPRILVTKNMKQADRVFRWLKLHGRLDGTVHRAGVMVGYKTTQRGDAGKIVFHLFPDALAKSRELMPEPYKVRWTEVVTKFNTFEVDLTDSSIKDQIEAYGIKGDPVAVARFIRENHYEHAILRWTEEVDECVVNEEIVND